MPCAMAATHAMPTLPEPLQPPHCICHIVNVILWSSGGGKVGEILVVH